MVDKRLINVFLLGLGFMFVFMSFQTISNIEKTILDSVHSDNPSYNGEAYTSLAIIYAVVAICNWTAPSIITITGPRLAMVLGAVCYALFIASFLIPITWILYIASVLIGFGASLIWTGQGMYLTLNSDSTTMSRNSGIFWAMLQCSILFGNTFVFFAFENKPKIDLNTRTFVYIVLTSVSCIGIIFLMILRPAINPEGTAVTEYTSGPLEALKSSFNMLKERNMLLLNITFFSTGTLLSFSSGVYGPSIGFTTKIAENAKQLVGLSGILFGLGEVIGGTLFGILGKRMVVWGRNPVIITGGVVQLLSFVLIFINLPNDSPFHSTTDTSFITPNKYLAIACSFLLGFGDSCYNTQIYSILGNLYSENSAPAFALFKFTQSVATAFSFVYCNVIGLYPQLAILVIITIAGSISFFIVERRSCKITHNISQVSISSTSPVHVD